MTKQETIDLDASMFELNRILHRLGHQHDRAEQQPAGSAILVGAFRAEDLGTEGRECEDCEDECYCGEGDRWDELETKISRRALERLTAAFPSPHSVSLSYGEKGWYSVGVTLVAKPTTPAKKTKPAKASTTSKSLTPKQAETLEWVRSTLDPTGTAAADFFGLTNSAARDRLARLAKRGLLEFYPGPLGRTYSIPQEG